MVHAVDPRALTAVLPPVMSKIIDPCPLTQLVFREDSVITTCVDGRFCEIVEGKKEGLT
jgi:hypothetical protein